MQKIQAEYAWQIALQIPGQMLLRIEFALPRVQVPNMGRIRQGFARVVAILDMEIMKQEFAWLNVVQTVGVILLPLGYASLPAFRGNSEKTLPDYAKQLALLDLLKIRAEFAWHIAPPTPGLLFQTEFALPYALLPDMVKISLELAKFFAQLALAKIIQGFASHNAHRIVGVIFLLRGFA